MQRTREEANRGMRTTASGRPSRKSMFAGCSQSMTRTRSVLRLLQRSRRFVRSPSSRIALSGA